MMPRLVEHPFGDLSAGIFSRLELRRLDLLTRRPQTPQGADWWEATLARVSVLAVLVGSSSMQGNGLDLFVREWWAAG
jgi:hypothetical protein